MNDLYAWAIRHNISQQALAELRDLSKPSIDTRLAYGDAEMSESRVQSEIRLGASRVGAMLLRNNSGVLYNPAGRPVRFGLGNDSAKLNEVFKSPDLVGLTSRGQFLGVECKPVGWTFKENDSHERAQRNCIDAIIRHGGIGMFATSWEQVRSAIAT